MVTLQRRLAADVLKCGARRLWFDPAEMNEISSVNSRAAIRKMVRDGVIIKKPVRIRSRASWRKRKEAKSKGRHMGLGKRKGTREARTPSKTLWIKRLRVLRRLLKKYREMKKIDRHMYHTLYMKSKGNEFKSKRNLMEAVWKLKAEKARSQQIKEQLEARRNRTQLAKEKRAAKESRRAERAREEAAAAAKRFGAKKQ